MIPDGVDSRDAYDIRQHGVTGQQGVSNASQ